MGNDVFLTNDVFDRNVDHPTNDDRDYLSLTFDFAGLTRPIYAILMKDPNSESYGAFWSRAKKPVFE